MKCRSQERKNHHRCNGNSSRRTSQVEKTSEATKEERLIDEAWELLVPLVLLKTMSLFLNLKRYNKSRGKPTEHGK